MRQGISLAALGLCAGLALAGGLAEGQEKAGQVAQGSWPPSVADRIVNVTGIAGFKKPGDQEVLYTVPDDLWLVITDLRTTKTKKMLFPEPDLEVRLKGAKKGTLVIPWQLSGSDFAGNTGSGVGFKFPPGSDVVLARTADGTSRLDCFYFLAGYLTE
ncbi:MAG: hypothetical protein V2A76_09840 [Planctomycetota bacterium]